jgi:integrase
MKKGIGVYKRSGSPYYYGWCTVNGEQKGFSTKQTVKTKAEQFVNNRYKELLQGKEIPKEKHQKTVEAAADEYLLAFKKNPKKTNYKNAKSLLKQVCDVFGHKKIKNLKDKDILDYIDKRRADGKADGTIKLELDYARAAIRRASKDKQAISDIFKISKTVDELIPNENQHQFTHEQYLKFVEVCPDWLALMVKIGYQFPLRAKELRKLTFQKIDLHHKTIRLEKTKRYKKRELKLRGKLFEEIKQWCEKYQDKRENVFPKL